MNHKIFFYALLLFTAGCSDNSSNKANKPVQKSVFKDQLESLDKAKAVEQQLKDSAAKQRQLIKQQGG